MKGKHTCDFYFFSRQFPNLSWSRQTQITQPTPTLTQILTLSFPVNLLLPSMTICNSMIMTLCLQSRILQKCKPLISAPHYTISQRCLVFYYPPMSDVCLKHIHLHSTDSSAMAAVHILNISMSSQNDLIDTSSTSLVDSLRRQNGCQFVNNIFKCTVLN